LLGTEQRGAEPQRLPYFLGFGAFAAGAVPSKKDNTHANGAFQLMVISFTLQASMWSTKHF
jgi:hypothetical protein